MVNLNRIIEYIKTQDIPEKDIYDRIELAEQEYKGFTPARRSTLPRDVYVSRRVLNLLGNRKLDRGWKPSGAADDETEG